jgi:hypothetical protein
MDNAATGSHPLHIAAFQVAAVAQVVLMQHMAVEHVSDRFETAVRMTWESGDVIIRVFGAELVEHQKGVQSRLR